MSISEERIKEVLRNYEKELMTIQIKLESLEQEKRVSDEILNQVQQIQGEQKKLEPVIQNRLLTQKKMEEAYGLLLDRLRQFLEEREMEIQYIWVCFTMLPQMEYELLDQLYVKGKLWECVKEELGLSQRRMIQIRKQAILHIQEIYEAVCETKKEDIGSEKEEEEHE